MQFLTINSAARETGLPHSRLRVMQSQGRLPGFYAGSRYYVNMDQFRAQLDDASRHSLKPDMDVSA